MDFRVNMNVDKTAKSYLKVFATEKNFRSTHGTVMLLCSCSYWSVGVVTQQWWPFFTYVVNTEQMSVASHSQKHRPWLLFSCQIVSLSLKPCLCQHTLYSVFVTALIAVTQFHRALGPDTEAALDGG